MRRRPHCTYMCKPRDVTAVSARLTPSIYPHLRTYRPSESIMAANPKPSTSSASNMEFDEEDLLGMLCTDYRHALAREIAEPPPTLRCLQEFQRICQEYKGFIETIHKQFTVSAQATQAKIFYLKGRVVCACGENCMQQEVNIAHEHAMQVSTLRSTTFIASTQANVTASALPTAPTKSVNRDSSYAQKSFPNYGKLRREPKGPDPPTLGIFYELPPGVLPPFQAIATEQSRLDENRARLDELEDIIKDL